MAFVARAFSPSVGVTPYSDLESVEFRDGALVVAIACTVNGDRTVRTVNGLRVTFTQVAGFRVLDELDLARYVASGGFPFGSHVLEVCDGGWSAEENALQMFDMNRREWLVVTGNWCVSVFSGTPPEIVDATWKFVE